MHVAAITLVSLVCSIAPAWAAGEATVRLEVEAQAWQGALRLTAETRWLGEERSLELTDHGEAAGDVAGDGIRVGTWEGAPVQALPVRLVLQEPGEAPVVVYEGVEVIVADDDRLSWQLLPTGEDGTGPPRAWRVARPLQGAALPARSETGRIVAAGMWALLVCNLVGWLWWGRRVERR